MEGKQQKNSPVSDRTLFKTESLLLTDWLPAHLARKANIYTQKIFLILPPPLLLLFLLLLLSIYQQLLLTTV